MDTYDIILRSNPGLYEVEIPDFDVHFRIKGSRRDAISLAAEHLKTAIQVRLSLAKELPEPSSIKTGESDTEVVTLAVEIPLPLEGLLTVEQAMQILDVSQSRISHLIRDGHLLAVKHGRRKLIAQQSLEAYLLTPRTPGRPKRGYTYEFINLKSELEEKL